MRSSPTPSGRCTFSTTAAPVARKVMGGEYAILGLLFLIGATGLILLMVRHTGAMGFMLAFHFGLVLEGLRQRARRVQLARRCNSRRMPATSFSARVTASLSSATRSR